MSVTDVILVYGGRIYIGFVLLTVLLMVAFLKITKKLGRKPFQWENKMSKEQAWHTWVNEIEDSDLQTPKETFSAGWEAALRAGNVTHTIKELEELTKSIEKQERLRLGERIKEALQKEMVLSVRTLEIIDSVVKEEGDGK